MFSLAMTMATKSVAKNSLLVAGMKGNLRLTFAQFRLRIVQALLSIAV
jgi:hypothetical protein